MSSLVPHIDLLLLGRLRSSHLTSILASMVASGAAIYEPPNQTQSVLLFWRSPEEWAQVLYDWVRLSHVSDFCPSAPDY